MALSRLLLLCMVASEVWDAETKPTEFVCSKGARRAMNIVAQMERTLSDCNDPTTLPTPVQLPCTELHVASWENQSHQEKRGDVVASLGLLAEGVKAVRALGQTGCTASLLQRLQNNVNNYLLILTQLQLSEYLCPGSDEVTLCDRSLPSTGQDEDSSAYFPSETRGPVVSPALSCVPRSTGSLSTVLLSYNQLISGKLERFMVGLRDRCTSQ